MVDSQAQNRQAREGMEGGGWIDGREGEKKRGKEERVVGKYG